MFIALAEGLGGVDNYSLMLAAVKPPFRFTFLNGASPYALYLTWLLIHTLLSCRKLQCTAQHAETV